MGEFDYLLDQLEDDERLSGCVMLRLTPSEKGALERIAASKRRKTAELARLVVRGYLEIEQE